MEDEISGAKFTDEVKPDAVAQVEDRGYAVCEVAERLGVSTKSIYTWQRLFSRPVKVIQEVDAQADGFEPDQKTVWMTVFPANGDILKKGLPVDATGSRAMSNGRYAFIAEKRLVFAVRAKCRMLAVHQRRF